MAVLLETTVGDIVIDLYPEERPRCCLNFLKLCKMKYYNFNIFHSVQSNFMAQTGDPTGTGTGGESVFCKLQGEDARFFDMELHPRIKHKKKGCVSMVNNGTNQHGSQFFITLRADIDYLDGIHSVFGEVTEGFDVLDKISETFCDGNHRPLQDIRINHTVILDDPFDDPEGLEFPDRSPEIDPYKIKSDRIAADEDIEKEKNKTVEEVKEETEAQETRAKAQILEMIGDLPDAEVKPPENVLFVCKLNPVTTSEDLEIIFSRFGKISSCDVIKDQATGDSLCYAFVEFEKEEECEEAYFKMDNVLIDDRRIHVDFSQSVAKLQSRGKGPVMPQRPNAANKPRGQRSRDGGYQGAPDNRRDARSGPERAPRKKDCGLTERGSSESPSSSSDRSASRKRKKETATPPDDRTHDGKSKGRKSRSPSPTPERSSSHQRRDKGDPSGDRSHDRKIGRGREDRQGEFHSPSPERSSNKKSKETERSRGRSDDRKEERGKRGRSSSESPSPDRSSNKKRRETERSVGVSHDREKERRKKDRRSKSHSPSPGKSSHKWGDKKDRSGDRSHVRKSGKRKTARSSSGSPSPSPDRSSSNRSKKKIGEKGRRSDSESSAVDRSLPHRKRIGDRSCDKENKRSRNSSSDSSIADGRTSHQKRSGDRSHDRKYGNSQKKPAGEHRDSSDGRESEDVRTKQRGTKESSEEEHGISDRRNRRERRSSREKSSNHGQGSSDRSRGKHRRSSSRSSTESSSSGEETSEKRGKGKDKRKKSKEAHSPEANRRKKGR